MAITWYVRDKVNPTQQTHIRKYPPMSSTFLPRRSMSNPWKTRIMRPLKDHAPPGSPA